MLLGCCPWHTSIGGGTVTGEQLAFSRALQLNSSRLMGLHRKYGHLPR